MEGARGLGVDCAGLGEGQDNLVGCSFIDVRVCDCVFVTCFCVYLHVCIFARVQLWWHMSARADGDGRHGRDGKLLVWQYRYELDEAHLCKILPVEAVANGEDTAGAGAASVSPSALTAPTTTSSLSSESRATPFTIPVHHRKPWLLHSLPVNALNFCSFAAAETAKGLLVAVPSVRDGEIAGHLLPSGERVFSIGQPPGVKTGESRPCVRLVRLSR